MGDSVRVTTEFPYQTSCQRELADGMIKRRQAFDQQGKIVLWETCIRKDQVELAQNSH